MDRSRRRLRQSSEASVRAQAASASDGSSGRKRQRRESEAPYRAAEDHASKAKAGGSRFGRNAPLSAIELDNSIGSPKPRGAPEANASSEHMSRTSKDLKRKRAFEAHAADGTAAQRRRTGSGRALEGSTSSSSWSCSPSSPRGEPATTAAMALPGARAPNAERRRPAHAPPARALQTASRGRRRRNRLEQSVVDAAPSASAAQEECGICFEVIQERGLLDCCAHIFCLSCIDQWLQRSCRCPHCKAAVKRVTSSKSGVSKKVAQRELEQTLAREEAAEEEDSEEDFHDFMDQVSLQARAAGLHMSYVHRTVMPRGMYPGQPVAAVPFRDYAHTNHAALHFLLRDGQGGEMGFGESFRALQHPGQAAFTPLLDLLASELYTRGVRRDFAVSDPLPQHMFSGMQWGGGSTSSSRSPRAADAVERGTSANPIVLDDEEESGGGVVVQLEGCSSEEEEDEETFHQDAVDEESDDESYEDDDE